ncbi:MAG: F0F1 ATP synthase subunit B [Proteobacteria bacterium]|nr:F0F1 ATP synthase subunit B [Pseudomonadota bacterium]
MKRLYWLLAVVLLLPASAMAAEGGLKLLSFTTLIGEIITFAILVWVVMKFVWPPLMNAIENRQKEIADGLAAAERGHQELADADQTKVTILSEARSKGSDMVADSKQRGDAIIDAARQEAENEKARIIEQGQRDLDAERVAMHRAMEEKLGSLIISGAEQILRREVDTKTHQDIIDSMKKAV